MSCPAVSSPLGARGLYLYRGGADTRYRIHGTNDLESIGRKSSAGCIRMFNHDIIELYELVGYGTVVKVRTLDESITYEGPELASRNDELGELAPATPVVGPDGTITVVRNFMPIEPKSIRSSSSRAANAVNRSARHDQALGWFDIKPSWCVAV